MSKVWIKYFNWTGILFVLLILSTLTSCLPEANEKNKTQLVLANETETIQQAEVKIERIGDGRVDPSLNTDIIVSKPMPVIVKGSFVSLGDRYIYVLQKEAQPWYIQPPPAINDSNQTFTARVWFGTDSLPTNGVFTLTAIMVDNEIPLVDGANPIDALPDHITRSDMITVIRQDQ